MKKGSPKIGLITTSIKLDSANLLITTMAESGQSKLKFFLSKSKFSDPNSKSKFYYRNLNFAI